MLSNKGSGGLPGTGARGERFKVKPWMRSELLHQWVQTGGILVATVWGVVWGGYTFLWKNILLPSWELAHLNVEISLTPLETRPTSALRELLVTITATNPSERKLYLERLSNTWQLHGIQRLASIGGTDDQPFSQLGNQVLRNSALDYAERDVVKKAGPLLAVGRLFDDEIIHPGETISRSILIGVADDYDAAQVQVVVPALTKKPDHTFLKGNLSERGNGNSLEWELSQEEHLIPTLCRHSAEGANDSSHLRNNDCEEISGEEVDRRLRRFDRLYKVFQDREQVALPEVSREVDAAQ